MKAQISSSRTQTPPLLSSQSPVNVKWQCNDFWAFPLFMSRVRVRPKDSPSAVPFSQTEHKHTEVAGSPVRLVWLRSCYIYTLSVSNQLNSSRALCWCDAAEQISHWNRKTLGCLLKWQQTTRGTRNKKKERREKTKCFSILIHTRSLARHCEMKKKKRNSRICWSVFILPTGL